MIVDMRKSNTELCPRTWMDLTARRILIYCIFNYTVLELHVVGSEVKECQARLRMLEVYMHTVMTHPGVFWLARMFAGF